jgi:hypothetical protein
MPTRQGKKKRTYGKSWGQEVLIDLELPSFDEDDQPNVVLVRRPGVAGLVKAGILDSLDSLTGIVQTEHIDRVARAERGKTTITAEDVKDLASNKEQLLRAMELADRVVEYVVVEPHVLRPVVRDERGKPVVEKHARLADAEHPSEWIEEREIPLPDDQRVEGQIYLDVVDLMDKMYIFQFVVGGVSDLERFREEFGESLASMGPVEDVQGSPQSALQD